MQDALTVAPLETVRSTLRADHARIDRVTRELLEAFDADDREGVERLWTQLDSVLMAHLAAEERFMIPALSRAHPEEARRILDEHRSIRASLARLGMALDLHLVRADVARAFIDELRAHARAEDTVYAWADRSLAPPEKRGLLATLAAGIEDLLSPKVL